MWKTWFKTNRLDCRFPLEAGLTSRLVFHHFGSLELYNSFPSGLHVLWMNIQILLTQRLLVSSPVLLSQHVVAVLPLVPGESQQACYKHNWDTVVPQPVQEVTFSCAVQIGNTAKSRWYQTACFNILWGKVQIFIKAGSTLLIRFSHNRHLDSICQIIWIFGTNKNRWNKLWTLLQPPIIGPQRKNSSE